jgi:hypothetical protein
VFDATIPYDVRFFESLHRVVQAEAWFERDKLMIDSLRSIGIEKGKPFQPDAQTRDVLNAAALEARAWIETEYERALAAPFAEGARWAVPLDHSLREGLQTNYANPE